MQKSKTMALTDKQIKSIHNLDAQAALEVMHECAERLGLVSVIEFEAITGVKRRTTYQAIADKKKMHFELSGHVFPAINDE